MDEKETYRLKDWTMTIDRTNFLVVVHKNGEDAGTEELSQMPSWIFASRYAIWLTAGDAPIRVRAMEGEQIKQNLIQEFSLI